MQLEPSLAQAYVALPGEKLYLNQISPNQEISNVKTSERDFDVLKTKNQVGLQCRHAGWVWNQSISSDSGIELKVALFGGCLQYYPEKGDYVIATIVKKTTENYFCSLGCGNEYLLNVLDFEGATKKNHPNLEIGSVVYSRVVENTRYLRGRLSCVNPSSKKEWVTGESLFGQLIDGYSIEVPLNFTEELLSKQKKPQFLKELSKYCNFEICIGRNGKIWVKCEQDNQAIVLINLIRNASQLQNEQRLLLIEKWSSLFKQ